MKILVCGGRYFGWSKKELAYIYSQLYSFLEPKPRLFQNNVSSPHTLISGEADGVDIISKYFAKELYRLNYKGYPADWDSYGNAAGPIRNSQMLKENPDIYSVVAFPGGKGTNDMIKKANKKNIRVVEFEYSVPYKELEKQRKGKVFPWQEMKNI